LPGFAALFRSAEVKLVGFILVYAGFLYALPGSVAWSYAPSLKWFLSVLLCLLIRSWTGLLLCRTSRKYLAIPTGLTLLFFFLVPVAIFLAGRVAGYGMGFYEVFLASIPLACALCATLANVTSLSRWWIVAACLAAMTLTLLSCRWSRDYLLFNFTNAVPMTLVETEILGPNQPIIKLAIPRAYFEGGNTGRCAFGKSICLEFIYPEMTPAFARRFDKSARRMKVEISLGGEFFGRDITLSRVKEAGIAPAEPVFGLDYYAESWHAPYIVPADFYVPREDRPEFVFSCDGRDHSNCHRHSLGNTKRPEYSYRFTSADLPNWREMDERIDMTLQSFIVQ
jgi:hypothetical protein